MDYTHVHLLLNHFPIVGSLIGTVLLLFGLWKNNISIQKISLLIIFIMALLAIPVFLTGEPAEEKVENLPGVMESIIEDHEEASQIAFWFLIAAGVISIISFAMQFLLHSSAKTAVLISLLVSITASGLMMRAGYYGGQIRHTEIRKGQANIQNVTQPAEQDED